MIALALRLAFNPHVWLVVGAFAVVAYLIHWGDKHGSNARKVAAIERQLADTNARLTGYAERDERAAIADEHARESGYLKAIADLGSTNKCLVTPAMVTALSRIDR